jgi:hypothetical protein
MTNRKIKDQNHAPVQFSRIILAKFFIIQYYFSGSFEIIDQKACRSHDEQDSNFTTYKCSIDTSADTNTSSKYTVPVDVDTSCK